MLMVNHYKNSHQNQYKKFQNKLTVIQISINYFYSTKGQKSNHHTQGVQTKADRVLLGLVKKSYKIVSVKGYCIHFIFVLKKVLSDSSVLQNLRAREMAVEVTEGAPKNKNADANGVKDKGKKIIRIQVSKTKKPFFFYLNLAKVSLAFSFVFSIDI